MASDAQGIRVVEMPTGAFLPAKRTSPTHVAHALDAASVAAYIEAVAEVIDGGQTRGEAARLAVKALGLGGDDA